MSDNNENPEDKYKRLAALKKTKSSTDFEDELTKVQAEDFSFEDLLALATGVMESAVKIEKDKGDKANVPNLFRGKGAGDFYVAVTQALLKKSGFPSDELINEIKEKMKLLNEMEGLDLKNNKDDLNLHNASIELKKRIIEEFQTSILPILSVFDPIRVEVGQDEKAQQDYMTAVFTGFCNLQLGMLMLQDNKNDKNNVYNELFKVSEAKVPNVEKANLQLFAPLQSLVLATPEQRSEPEFLDGLNKRVEEVPLAEVPTPAASPVEVIKVEEKAPSAKKPGLLTRLWNGIKGIGSAIVGVFKSKPAETAPPAQEVVEARPLEKVMPEKANEEVTVTAPVTVKVKLSHVQDFNLQRNPDANVMKKGEPDKKDKSSRETQCLKDLRRSAKVEVKNNQDPLKKYEINELMTYTEEQKNELLSKIQSDAAKRGELEQYFHQGGFRNLAQNALHGYMGSQNQALGLERLTEKYIFEVQDNGDIRFTESYQIAEIRAQPDPNAEVGQLMKPTIPATGTVTLTSTLSWDSKGALQVKSGDLILESNSLELTKSFKILSEKVQEHQNKPATQLLKMLTEDPLGAESSFTELQPPSKTLLRQAEEVSY